MALWLWLLLLLVVVVVVVVAVDTLVLLRPLPRGVPHVRGLPLLGAAAALGSDAPGFFARHGPAFATYLFRQPVLVLTHLADFQHVYKHAREFSIEEPQADIAVLVTGTTRDNMLALPSTRIHALWPKYLSDPGLAPTSADAVRRFVAEIASGARGTAVGDALAAAARPDGGGWAAVPTLFDLTYRVVFYAGVPAVLGSGLDPRALVDDMRAFDDAMQLMVVGAPAFFTRAGFRARDRIAAAVRTQLRRAGVWEDEPESRRTADGGAPLLSPLQFERIQLYREVLSEADIATGSALIMWVIHTNSAPACFWLLTFLLATPAALAAVRAEIDAVAAAHPGFPATLPAGATSCGAVYDRLLPALTSAAWETLRLRISAYSTRTVTTPYDLPLATGGTCSLQAGDQVLIAPCHHLDPAVFADPGTFNYRRFLPDPATGKPPEFFQDGSPLRMPVFCFGGGSHMCPGRFLALNEMRTYAFTMLRHWDLELVGPVPPTASRPGLGVLPPARDVAVRMRRRPDVRGASAGRSL